MCLLLILSNKLDLNQETRFTINGTIRELRKYNNPSKKAKFVKTRNLWACRSKRLTVYTKRLTIYTERPTVYTERQTAYTERPTVYTKRRTVYTKRPAVYTIQLLSSFKLD